MKILILQIYTISEDFLNASQNKNMKYQFSLLLIIFLLSTSLCYSQQNIESNKEKLYNALSNTEISLVNRKKTFKLKDYKEKVILVIFFAYWSGPCVQQAKELQVIKTEFQKDNLFVIGLNPDEEEKSHYLKSSGKSNAKSSTSNGSSTTSKEFWKLFRENRFDFPIGFVDENLFTSLVAVTRKNAIPQTLIINGEIKEIYVGGNKTEKIRQYLKDIFRKR